jgi:hypothetical protein
MTNVKQQKEQSFYDRVSEYDKKMRKFIWGDINDKD